MIPTGKLPSDGGPSQRCTVGSIALVFIFLLDTKPSRLARFDSRRVIGKRYLFPNQTVYGLGSALASWDSS